MRTDPKIDISDLTTGHDDVGRPKSARSVSSLAISAVVKGKDEKFKPWSETASVTSLSSSGAGFFITAPCVVGQLVSLIMPMPAQYRKYDHDKRLYRVWGLVQYCYEAGGDESAGFHVGVALIGKDAPESYTRRSQQCYRVSGMDRNGLWKIEELEQTFKQRSSVRYWNSIDVSLFQIDDEQRSIASEKTVTENISETGALVFSELRVAVGDRIKLQSSSPPFSGLCVVRHRRIGVDDRTRLHLEFVETAFPILEIEAPIEEDGEH
jgi:hypothetical protein